MTPYLVTFALSGLLLFASERMRSTSRLVQALLAIASVMAVSILAGLREWTVGGPDAVNYGQPIFESAESSSNFLQAISQSQYVGAKGALGYIFINFVVSRFTSSFPFFLFALSLVTNGIVLAGILQLREWGSVPLMWLTYLLTAYPTTFNLLRQSVALALTLAGICLFVKGRHRLSLFVGISGAIFHTSGILFILAYLLCLYCEKESKLLHRGILRVIMISTLLAGIALAGGIGFASKYFVASYGSYLQNDPDQRGSLGVNILYRLVPISVGMLATGRSRQIARAEIENGEISSRQLSVSTNQAATYEISAPRSYAGLLVLLSLLCVDLTYVTVRAWSSTLSRIVMYFSWARVMAYSIFTERLRMNASLRWTIVLAFCFGYFYWIFIASGAAVFTFENSYHLL